MPAKVTVARQPPDGFRFAGPWFRLLAFIVDGLIVALPLSLLFVLVVLVRGGGFDYADYLLDPAKSGWVTGALLDALSSAATIGWLAMWQATAGASPGMMLCRLQVRGPDAQDKPSLPAAVVRNSIPVLANVGSITANTGINAALSLLGFGCTSPSASRYPTAPPARASTTDWPAAPTSFGV